MTIKVESATEPTASVSAASTVESHGSGDAKNNSVPADAGETTENSEDSAAADEGEELDSKAGEDSGSTEDDAEKNDEKPKPLNGFKKKIHKLSRRLAEKDQELEYWKRQAMEGKAPPEKQTNDFPKPTASGAPNADDFATYEDYLEAKFKHIARQETEEREAKVRETEAKAAQQNRVSAHEARVKTFMDETPDYADVISEAMDELGDEFRVSPSVERLIVKRDDGPRLLYELAKDPNNFRALCEMSYEDAAFELGQLAFKLQKPAGQDTKPKATSAPKPLARVGSKASAGPKSIHDPNLSQAEYERLRRAERERRA